LSGGGFLGLYTISVLAELERQIAAPIATKFDLLAGTSVGGIIALGLACEIPAADIKSAFERNGTSIFSDRPAPKGALSKLWDVIARASFKPKYRSAALRRTITEIIGEETTLGDLQHPCIVPTVNLTKGGPQVFKTDHHPDFRRDHLLRAVDVALATSAAPTYFPIAQVNDGLYADGGMFANSPDLMALHEAEHFLGKSIADIRLLSVGTTTARFSFSHESGVNFGLVRWSMGQRLVQAMISSQQQMVDFMVRHKLSDRYLRMDAQQSREQEQALALDVATLAAQSTIRSLADVTVQANLNNPLLVSMLSHHAAPATFFHRRHKPSS
jgi:patatin-like phospholipase/acyl hydrolase